MRLGKPAASYSAHSCRIGGASMAWRAGCTVLWIMQQGFWRTVAGILPYLRRLPEDDGACVAIFLTGAGAARVSPAEQEADLAARAEQERARSAAGAIMAADADSDDDI